MHKRKHFLVYPPNYKPGDGYVTTYSKRQAWKVAIKLGHGTCIDVAVYRHKRKHSNWYSSGGYRLWEVHKKESIYDPIQP